MALELKRLMQTSAWHCRQHCRHLLLLFKNWQLGDSISNDLFGKEKFNKDYLSAVDYPRLRRLFSDTGDPFKKELSKRE